MRIILMRMRIIVKVADLVGSRTRNPSSRNTEDLRRGGAGFGARLTPQGGLGTRQGVGVAMGDSDERDHKRPLARVLSLQSPRSAQRRGPAAHETRDEDGPGPSLRVRRG